MPISDTHKTQKQEKQAEASKLSLSGKTAYLCRFTFSGNYFVIPDWETRPDNLWHAPNHPEWEVVETYRPAT